MTKSEDHNHRHHHRDEKKAHHDEESKKNMVSRLSRIEGQVRGIARMIDEDVYCDDVLHQISSVESAFQGVKAVLLEAHLKSCVIEQLRAGDDSVVDELLVTLRKMMK
ncbi:MAG: metal-sensing transcriptional repressor [bacterium]|nr:metal-sensing transcriptional repressor [bacterium]